MAKMWLKGISAAVAVATVLSLAPATMAQGPGTQAGTGTTQTQGTGAQRGPRGGGPVPLPLVAETIGITIESLRTELAAGHTIAQIAQANGVSLEELVDGLIAPKAEQLAQLVEDGTLTQEEADAKLAEARTRLTAQVQQVGQAGGGRPGRGGGGGGGRPPRPTATPAAPTN